MTPVTSIPADATVIFWFFFAIALVATFGFAFGLIYHWLRYGSMYPLVWIAMPLYVVGAIILIGGMLAGIGAL
ncbi:MAG: hypothetical protein V4449_03860 [Patescibacteria group bacterium]